MSALKHLVLEHFALANLALAVSASAHVPTAHFALANVPLAIFVFGTFVSGFGFGELARGGLGNQGNPAERTREGRVLEPAH